MMQMGAVGAVCALVGGAAGIAASSASSPAPTKAAGASVIAEGPGPRLGFGPLAERPGPWLGFGPLADAAGPPVHSENVVPNRKGGFDSVTTDRGSFSSLSADQLTITEGTKTATYKTVTLTIPSGATVRRNGDAAKLSDLKSGDTVMVLQSPQGTVVMAFDAQHPDVLQLKLSVPRKGEHPMPLPKPPTIPLEGSSSNSGEGAPAPESGASS
jgi:hypothetical protein